MAVDPRAKGARAETAVRDRLRELTTLQWERVPASGALDSKHGLKGDLYVPNEKNLWSVEVKHYADDQFTTSIFTAKNPTLIEWWTQAVRQGKQVDKLPLLIFKHDRSKIFVAFGDLPTGEYRCASINSHPYYFTVALLDDWYAAEKPKFILV
jgi:hypothetical protein